MDHNFWAELALHIYNSIYIATEISQGPVYLARDSSGTTRDSPPALTRSFQEDESILILARTNTLYEVLLKF